MHQVTLLPLLSFRNEDLSLSAIDHSSDLVEHRNEAHVLEAMTNQISRRNKEVKIGFDRSLISSCRAGKEWAGLSPDLGFRQQ